MKDISRLLLICRNCAVKYSAMGDYVTASIEVDAETLSEVDTVSLVQECPDCWDPMMRGKQ